MAAESSVVKCSPSLLAPRSAPPHTIHVTNENHRKSANQSNNANQHSKSCQSANREGNAFQASIKCKQEDIENLVPANIRHKYGSSVVDQLISSEQVRSHLGMEERTRCHQEYHIPRLRMKACFKEDYPHRMYYELGHCLRSNLFPGMPIKQNSLVHDSYTAEVNKRGRLDKRNSPHWHGRKTDDLAIWSEMLVKRKTIAKILQSQLKPSRAFPSPIRIDVPKAVPPPPPLKQPKKLRKPRHLAKSENPEVQPPPVSIPKEEDDFWDFYDKPIQ